MAGPLTCSGGTRKRIFAGHTLYWNDDGSELGVFRTAKGQFVYWYWPGDGERETFQLHPSLQDVFYEHQNLDELRTEIQDAYAELQGETITEELDI